MESEISVHYTVSATNFSFSLFRELSTSVESNVFASTYSIHFLLLLLTIGSKSKTNDELVSVLGLPKQKSPNYEKIKQVIENIENPDYLTVANGIFSDKAFDLSTDYENEARNYLKSEVRKVDFADNPSAGESEINEWTKNKTNGKISKIFEPGTIKSDAALVLTSAVYFKNSWKSQFLETKNEMFCLSAKDHIQVKMMHKTAHLKYFKDDGKKFAAVELPYRGGFEMLVVLPDRMDGIKSLEKTFLSDSTKFPILLANMTIHNVILAIPKFKFESDLNLEKTMEHLGCGSIFSPGADFSKMSSSGSAKLRVTDMKHKTFVEMDEKGTEAAGVNGVQIVPFSIEVEPPNIKTVHFHACHPFLFFIKKGNNIVFMGRLSNPNA